MSPDAGAFRGPRIIYPSKPGGTTPTCHELVKPWWKSLAVLGIAAGGCAFHAEGLVGPEGDVTVLNTLDGERYRLALETEDARPLAHLLNHTTAIDGTRVFRVVHVTDWKVLEGLHGMPAWVGVLQEQGGRRLGIADRNSEAFYVLDEGATDVLRPELGKVVLVEGYVEGPHQVHVVYYRVLAD